MTAALAAILTLAALKVACWAIPALAVAAVLLWRHERREGSFSRATEAAVGQAVGLVDDEAAIVREAERALREAVE